MILKAIPHKSKFFIIFLFFFSIIINQYYASMGVFPQDTFLHFDSGYRILKGEAPFKDYWTVSGPLVDYMQAFFFYLFGATWTSYILHASLFNALLTLSTYFVLRNFKLNTTYSFIYSFLFSVIAYPISGSPFVDLHATYLSILGIYSLILAFKTQKKIYWILVPPLLGFSFLAKQVPASYIIICIFLILILYSLRSKKLDFIKYSLFSSAIFIFFLLIFAKFKEISFYSFLDQYIFYPQTIGAERFKNLNLTFSGLVDHFKFIYIALIPFFFVNIKKIIFKKNYFKDNNFYIFITIIVLTFSLILSQLLTKNQTFISFLIPILTAFSHISLIDAKLKNENIIYFLIVLICLAITFKYHLRFNEGRKFHELQNVNLNLSTDAKKIHIKLSGLKWISHQYKDNPKEEVNLIKEIKNHLNQDSRNKMLITNYNFLSLLLDQTLISPSRSYAGDGTTEPLKGNKYEKKYKKLMDDLIKKNNISVIYVIDSSDGTNAFHYVNYYKHCFTKTHILKNLISYDLQRCQ